VLDLGIERREARRRVAWAIAQSWGRPLSPSKRHTVFAATEACVMPNPLADQTNAGASPFADALSNSALSGSIMISSGAGKAFLTLSAKFRSHIV
jgi:hypothetical protein